MLLLECGRAELWRGDVLRLPDSGDLGPDGGPVDVMVYDPLASGHGLGFIVISGYSAGISLFYLPEESAREDARCIDMDWLKSNWDSWFAYEWKWKTCVIDIARTEILEWDHRMIVETP
jgi:hypothetical protein